MRRVTLFLLVAVLSVSAGLGTVACGTKKEVAITKVVTVTEDYSLGAGEYMSLSLIHI